VIPGTVESALQRRRPKHDAPLTGTRNRRRRCGGVIRRLEHTAVSTGKAGDNRNETFGAPKEVRKLLRELAGAQMWQIEEVRPRPGQRWPTIYYEVTGPGGVVKTFGRPHEAWEYFQTLTNAPAARPEPPRSARARPGSS
jgi:hypothetical protein